MESEDLGLSLEGKKLKRRELEDSTSSLAVVWSVVLNHLAEIAGLLVLMFHTSQASG